MAPRFAPSRHRRRRRTSAHGRRSDAQPTTLAAGPPARPPSYQPPLGIRRIVAGTNLDAAATALPMRTSASACGRSICRRENGPGHLGAAAGQALNAVGHAITVEAKPLVPGGCATRSAAAAVRGCTPSSAPVATSPPLASAATARNVHRRDGDFEPTGSVDATGGRRCDRGRRLLRRSTWALHRAAVRGRATRTKPVFTGEPAAAPFGSGPQVALLDSPVLHRIAASLRPTRLFTARWTRALECWRSSAIRAFWRAMYWASQ